MLSTLSITSGMKAVTKGVVSFTLDATEKSPVTFSIKNKKSTDVKVYKTWLKSGTVKIADIPSLRGRITKLR